MSTFTSTTSTGMTKMTTRRPSRREGYLFRSGLCDMFRNTIDDDDSSDTPDDRHSLRRSRKRWQSKTDACALAFCGVWLWERNRFLLTGEKPGRWMERPLETGVVVLLVSTAVVWSLDPHNVFLSISLLLAFCCFLWKIFEFQYTRSVFRQRLAIEEYKRERKQRGRVGPDTAEGTGDAEGNAARIVFSTDEPATDPQNDPHLMEFLSEHQREVYGDGSHAFCGCASARFSPLDYSEEDGGDFCSILWSLLGNLCCGWLCQCYCQLCGMCAIAQEHRYLSEVLPADPHLWHRDYVTLQPWKEYYPAILRLRMSGQMSFLPHLKALSTLSNRIVVAAAIFLVLVTVVILFPVHFPRWQILVLYGTLLQPALILFFVYWWWHRLDVSLDAVVKYFASGFFICTGMSIVYETMTSIAASVFVYLISLLGVVAMILTGSIDLEDVLTGDDDDLGRASTVEVPLAYSITLALATAFLNAFLVAALVEEIGKYLCFWMVEHPDLEQDKVLLSAASSSEDATAVDQPDVEATKLQTRDQNAYSDIPGAIVAPMPSLVQLGAATTVAMIATALGFACAENLLYVFVYSPPGLNEEMSTLMVRCLFPIHPLAAAIQSLGVCRRDLENDSKTQVGRILLPAWLLHGSFDFSLMAYSLIARLLSPPESDGGSPTRTGTVSDESNSSILVVSCVMILPVIAVIFYFKEAWDQRDRLERLDRGNRNVV